jgi:hypothetical protein
MAESERALGLLSEFSGISYAAEAESVRCGLGIWGLESSGEAALARLTSLYQGIHDTPVFVGICYPQLADVEQEINGLMTFDRKPEFNVSELKKRNDMLQQQSCASLRAAFLPPGSRVRESHWLRSSVHFGFPGSEFPSRSG